MTTSSALKAEVAEANLIAILAASVVAIVGGVFVVAQRALRGARHDVSRCRRPHRRSDTRCIANQSTHADGCADRGHPDATASHELPVLIRHPSRCDPARRWYRRVQTPPVASRPKPRAPTDRAKPPGSARTMLLPRARQRVQGELAILVHPCAWKIWIDGQPQHQTPFREKHFAAGKHKLRLFNEDLNKDETMTITVRTRSEPRRDRTVRR